MGHQRDVVELWIQSAVQWLRLGVETVGALIIALGVFMALRQFISAALSRRAINFNMVRLSLARYLALALEFQLGADILSTAVAPTAKEISNLAAIAVIRTGLNYFLSREMKEEQEQENSGNAQRVEAQDSDSKTHAE